MRENRLKMIIFDMDGVILDSEPLHEIARQSLYRKYKVAPGEGIPDPVGISSKGFWGLLIEKNHLDAQPEELEFLQNKLVADQVEENHIPPSEGLLELLHGARKAGIRIGLASCASRYLVHRVLGILGIGDLFDVTVSGDEVPVRKPAPDVYLEVLRLAGISAGEAAAVEDTRSGVESAKAAGIYCYGYDNPTSGEQDISAADKVIRRMAEICY